MALYLFGFFISFIINFALFVPFIDLLYRLRFRRATQLTRDAFNKRTPIFDKFHAHKAGTPVGGGILIILTTLFTFTLLTIAFVFLGEDIVSNYPNVVAEVKILLFTFLSFSFLGLYDDLKKMFQIKDGSFFGLRLRHKLIIEILLAGIAAWWMYHELHISIINIPYFGVYNLGWLFIPFAVFVIVAFSNAINITDGLDGLSSGTLLIALFAFWIISASILDTPLLIFITAFTGGLAAFLYFNIYPARLFMGDTGALSFGATFAVIGLLLGKIFAVAIIGGVFMLEITSSFIQLLSKKYRGKRVFAAAPVHLMLQHKGWEEPKIVMRAWLVSVLFAILGLMIAFLK
ncbi:phospho-N-acetylmuramoyl-pentapeptide-transferase [Candidatus Roizmanbacteria bacterium RIFCSPLOWO2_02_FULL_43_10]|uniref:Phospho-N-acetylmuramoyl-pentapeptide-transferase n=2 Tax=Candidatus Roizmaniibacteriota TaxID=1752723 RepID=A0A1F7JX43_9BACT|nr:MAG: phospho-N-acetylmuramoyl-pentapeptide-transferase [Candidatus Roizmanbacteria bacterium RIFCSPHIGHO2_02_FULL_43_11]OGK60182.1 MAG: phospho-N-acetylmuramoyl-pentapeptide-transferase [Candidatus Roizmanbacteria bacterium RIFCSPLOWO2_02_FULL_43_10]